MTESAQQSTFVTVLAWIAILFSGLTAVMGWFQTVLISFLVPFPPMTSAEAQGVPVFMAWIFDNFQLVAFALAVFWSVAFVCSIGLLRRREWARLCSTAFLLFLTVSAVVVGVAQNLMMGDFFAGTAEVPPDFESGVLAIRIASGVMTVVFVAVFAWLATRLNSAQVRAEFRA